MSLPFFICMISQKIPKLRSELFFFFFVIKKNIQNEMQHRTAFIMQVVGMMLNNFSLLILWVVFLSMNGDINGWGVPEIIAINGVIALVYGTVFSLGDGLAGLPDKVHTGTFDTLILAPKNLFLRILSSSSRTSAIGDILFGVILLAVYFIMTQAPLSQILLLLLLCIPSIITFLHFLFLTKLIIFYIPDSESISNTLVESLMNPSFYPSGVFQGALRFFLFFIIPALAVAGMPIEMLIHFDWAWFLAMFGLAIFWTVLSHLVFKRALRRYESGNLVGGR